MLKGDEMTRSVRCAVQALVLCLGYFSLEASSAYGQSLKEQLVGSWTLVSMTRVIDDTEQPGLLGRDPVGQFMFGSDGRMCFNAMRRDRQKFDSPYPGGTSEEKVAAYDSYVGYCGRYEVNDEERSILFRVDLGTYPNWTGTTEKRLAEVTGTRLRIMTPPMLVGGKKIVGTVTWERTQ